MKHTNEQAILVEELHHIYDTETKLVRLLPKMARASSSPRLKADFERHFHGMQNHIQRIARLMKKAAVNPVDQSCNAIRRLIEEGERTLDRQTRLFDEFVGHDQILSRLVR